MAALERRFLSTCPIPYGSAHTLSSVPPSTRSGWSPGSVSANRAASSKSSPVDVSRGLIAKSSRSTAAALFTSAMRVLSLSVSAWILARISAF